MKKETKEKLMKIIDDYSSDEEEIALYSNYTKEELEKNTLIYDAKKEGIQEGIRQRNQEEKNRNC